MSDPNNPYKLDDKVFTKVKGEEVEATVRLVWKEEVQVRVPSGALLWRTVRTVRATATPVVEPAPVAPVETVTEAVPVPAEEPTVANAPSNEADAPSMSEGTALAESAQPNASPIEQVACGAPEIEADRKRAKENKQNKRRR